MDRRRQHRSEVGPFEHQVGRLAAQFLMHTLDRRGGRLRDRDPGAGRTREADHIDLLVARQRRADPGTVAVDQVEHPRRHSRRVEDLRQDHRAARGFLRRLQDHRVARRQRGCDLRADLVERPVPRRDHRHHPDRFVDDAVLADCFRKAEFFQRGERAEEIAEPRGCLRRGREADRRAHLLTGRLRQIGDACLVTLDDPFEQSEAVGDTRLAEARERLARRGDRLVDVGGAAERDLADRLFGRGIDDVVARAAVTLDPGTVDIMLQIAVHGGVLN